MTHNVWRAVTVALFTVAGAIVFFGHSIGWIIGAWILSEYIRPEYDERPDA